MKKILLLLLALVLLVNALADPNGATVVSNTTETKTSAPAGYLNTSGGTFTTLVLSSETQNSRWKAYAGNVTGVLTLDDSGNYSIYQWQLTALTGEVYATRGASVTWPSIGCASQGSIAAEEIAMNHTTASADSINSTFPYTIHREFYVGATKINQSLCRSTFTWVNDTVQAATVNAPFQEVLLHDGTNILYTTFIDDNTQGFNYNRYDFQLIVAERGVGGYPNTRYYFFMELQ